ncbi:uncharacterized protein LOC100901368 [Galendromus occidentalis]|uniref:Uncharacterized protein LOC100901368 n=1 Tax=Galendromus occidentalis TaxID=34638 RepID=A0AAJ6W0C3_9ACAR|nr:uncharacterized protein LOC100901368 [Galendromus occidentalis]
MWEKRKKNKRSRRRKGSGARIKDSTCARLSNCEEGPQPVETSVYLSAASETHGAAPEMIDERTDLGHPAADRAPAPEKSGNGGLFVPLDVPKSIDGSSPNRRIQQREGRSPDYRREANRKLQEHRRFQNQLPVSQRPSKKLRDECSMGSPPPGDVFDMDSLNTTADSISPDSSFAQDLTYDIVVDEEPRRRTDKKFTFGLNFAESALKPKAATRVRKVSEESRSLVSEEESDPHSNPGSSALQLSVCISSGSFEALAPCSIDVEDLIKCPDSSMDIVSFSYIPGSHKILTSSGNMSHEQEALRVVVSSRVETPVGNHSSYIRSPRLETWGRKPAAIVSPMKTPALSKAPPSQVVHGLRSALSTYERVVQILKKKLDEFSKNNTSSTEALATELVAEKNDNQKLENTVNTLEQAVQSTMLRMGEVRSANSELREVVQSQLDTLTQYKSQIEDLQFEKDQMRASHEKYVEQCDERLRREKHASEKQAALMRAQMEMKNMELDRLQHEAKIMKDQLAAFQKVINDLQQY